MNLFDIETYNFELDENKIAQNPVIPAHNSKMLVFENNEIKDLNFYNLSEILDDSRVLFFNNSRVLKSRIKLEKIRIITRAWNENFIDWEIFFLHKIDESTFEAMVNPGEKMKPKTKIFIWKYEIESLEITYSWRILRINNWNVFDLLEDYGQMPLPPYIEYTKEKEDSYQPVFASNPGSVASPTASLHFTNELLDKLDKKNINTEFVTLHVWLGTFKPIYVENIKEYEIHWEIVEINLDIFDKIANYKNDWKKILSIGTTSCRTLESLPYLWDKIKDKTDFSELTKNFWNNLELEQNSFIWEVEIIDSRIVFETKLYITPWFKFKVIDELITNFHLPKSTLLIMITSLIWYDNMKKIYNHALINNYRFFSFWDGMYLRNLK